MSFVTVLEEGGKSTVLLGNLVAELRQLSGATVSVQGTSRREGPREGLNVEGYDVLLIDGAEPAIGTLIATQGGLSLAGKDTLELASVPRGLAGKTGANVWIVGRRLGNKLEVQSYGILRETSE